MDQRTLKLTLSYDGTNYCGWQLQPNGLSLQAVVEQALHDFTGQPTKVVASGRTDAGVHAVGQVISFKTESTAPCHGFLHGLPIHLPEDVVVRAVVEANPDFNARFDARRKWYRYVIHNNPIRIPFLRNYTLWQRSRLDETAMHAAMQHLVGTHDFRCFESQWPNRSSSVRTVFHASVTRTAGWTAWNAAAVGRVSRPVLSSSDVRQCKPPAEPQVSCLREGEAPADPQVSYLREGEAPAEPLISADADFICFDIEADGFLYNMVRSIVGTLIHVGRGRWTPDDMRRILETGDRTHAGETAPPQGLYLMNVTYDVPASSEGFNSSE